MEARRAACGDVGQHANRAKHTDKRAFTTDLDEVDLHQCVPRRRDIGIHDGRDGVGYVVHGQELVDEHALSMSGFVESHAFEQRSLELSSTTTALPQRASLCGTPWPLLMSVLEWR